ncbi:MAG: DUF7499 family protein [Chlamydiota bacterium]
MTDYDLAERNDLFVINNPKPIMDVDDADYLVAMELLDHKEEKYHGQKVYPLYPQRGEPGSIIMMTMRVKVWNVRSDKPYIVLQEIVKSNHLVNRQESFRDYNQMPWGTTAYRLSPMGMAHTRLAKDIVKHLQTYITYDEK